MIQNGLNLGGTLWAGTNGITTSLGGNGATGYTALGVIRNDYATVGQPSAPIFTSFGGVSVGVNDVLVKYTWFGDADLNGVVNSNDYFQIDTGFLAHRTGWINGDFDYNGVINSNDYFVIDNAFLHQGGVTLAPAATTSLAATTVVPEPAVIGGASPLMLLAMRRRRRHDAANVAP
jgi:hypothetical protein